MEGRGILKFTNKIYILTFVYPINIIKWQIEENNYYKMSDNHQVRTVP
eukprot:SAG22_NODE_312_length_12614_cov_4.783540_8_plen_48_part_00